MLIRSVPVELDIFFHDWQIAALTDLCVLCHVVLMAVDLAVMLVVRILGTEHDCTIRLAAAEMMEMILSVDSGDVRSAYGLTAAVAEQIMSLEVVHIMAGEAFQVELSVYGSHELATQALLAFGAESLRL